MSRRFRRRPPLWLWLAIAIAIALASRSWLNWRDEVPTMLAGDAVVLSIVDGQTLDLAALHATRPATRVRLLGIQVVDDSAARQWLASNLAKQTVRIELDKRRQAKDGAQLAYVYLERIYPTSSAIWGNAVIWAPSQGGGAWNLTRKNSARKCWPRAMQEKARTRLRCDSKFPKLG